MLHYALCIHIMFMCCLCNEMIKIRTKVVTRKDRGAETDFRTTQDMRLIKVALANSFPGGSVAKNLPACTGEAGSITGSGRYPGGGGGNPLQYSCLQNPTDRSLADYVHGDPRVRDLATTTTSALHIKGGKEKEKQNETESSLAFQGMQMRLGE